MSDIEERLRRLAGELSGGVDRAHVEEEVRRRAGRGGWRRAARVPTIAFLVVALTVVGWVGLSAVFKGSPNTPPQATGSGPSPSAPAVVPPTTTSAPPTLNLSGTMAFLGAPGVYLLDPQTEATTKVAGRFAWGAGIQWSPDGSRIAYGLGLGEGHGQIVAYDVETKKTTVIVDIDSTGTEPLPPSYPAWSPDGQTLAFTTEGGHAYTVEADGSNLTQITGQTDDGCSDRQVAWSHDGSAILSARECQDRSLDGIYSFTPPDANARLIAKIGPSIVGLVVSPDGTTMAFGEGRKGVFVASTDGSGITQLTHGSDMFPAWSPDGTTIAFSRDDQVWAVPATGGDPVQVTHFSSTRVVDLAWSPIA
jgi:Tol biopolymer transport system component